MIAADEDFGDTGDNPEEGSVDVWEGGTVDPMAWPWGPQAAQQMLQYWVGDPSSGAGADGGEGGPAAAAGQYAVPLIMGVPPMVWVPPRGGAPGGNMTIGFPNRRSEKPSLLAAIASHGGQPKQRFCATYPNVNQCRHGSSCAFAHSRDEVQAPLLEVDEEMRMPEALNAEFFTQKFKTLWCPIGTQHDWQLCMYAHTYQDVRRIPSIGYGHQLCPYWSKKETTLAYAQRCPLGPRCPYAHGAKEQLYHPQYFRTFICRDLQRRKCPRRTLCAFFHKRAECRVPGPDKVDYSRPLPKSALPEEWLSHFLAPPHFQEVGGEEGATQATMGNQAQMFMQMQTAPMQNPAEEQVPEAGGEDTPRTQTSESGGGEDYEARLRAASLGNGAAMGCGGESLDMIGWGMTYSGGIEAWPMQQAFMPGAPGTDFSWGEVSYYAPFGQFYPVPNYCPNTSTGNAVD